jgi:hypothetical protein
LTLATVVSGATIHGLISTGTAVSNVARVEVEVCSANLAPDWLRIGADIIVGTTFNMTFSVAGNNILQAGPPGHANCHGQTVSAMAQGVWGHRCVRLNLGVFQRECGSGWHQDVLRAIGSATESNGSEPFPRVVQIQYREAGMARFPTQECPARCRSDGRL